MTRMHLARFAAASAAAAALVAAAPAFAGDCFQDPIHERNDGASVTTGARVRDVACMEGSTVMTTLPVGARVTIIADTDGWYKVRTGAGLEGWVGQWLLSVGGEPPASSPPTTEPTTNVQPLPATGLIRGVSTRAVYLVYNGKRWAFPTDRVFKSWYVNFNAVIVVSDADLARVPLAGNVTYRPGIRLVKLQTDPRVFAIGRYGVLRHIASEQAARELYGEAWGTLVDDIMDITFGNYLEGAPIVSSSDFSRTLESGVTAPTENIRPAGFTPLSETTGTAPVVSSVLPRIGRCTVFPADSPWNTRVDALPLHPSSGTFVSAVGRAAQLHPDFGENQDYGIPYAVVDGGTNVPITFDAYGDESDPGPYPIPAAAPVEGGSDRHVLVVDQDDCTLYELYAARRNAYESGWTANAGAVWHLNSNALRPENWTSADAAGLPILPGLVRYDEVAAGAIRHAIRFTAPMTFDGFIHPATHAAGEDNATLPPMGLRMRLRASYDISGFTGQARVIAEALKTYGIILADNGSSWFISGATDPRWNDDELNQLKAITGEAFEAVDTGATLPRG